MAFGIWSTNPSGTHQLAPYLLGGRTFVQRIAVPQQTTGTVSTYTYPLIPGGDKLRVLVSEGGAHEWSTSTNGANQAVLTVTAKSSRNARPSTFLVFTTHTTEPTYGVASVNDNGERLVSAVYPCPEFLGKVQLGQGSDYALPAAGWTGRKLSGAAPGNGRLRMVLYNIPITSSNTYWHGTNVLEPSNDFISVECLRDGGAPAVPTLHAYVFALDGLQRSTDQFTLVIRDAYGNLTYDGGLNHAVISGFVNSVDFPLSPAYGNNSVPGGPATNSNNLISLPSYAREIWNPRSSGIQRSDGMVESGCMRRSATTVDTRIIRTLTYDEDVVLDMTLTRGARTGNLIISFDGTQYGV